MASLLSGMAVPFTATQQLSKVPGLTLIGLLIVSSTTGATIEIYDSATQTTTTVLVPAMTFATATNPVFLPLYLSAAAGHYAVVTGTISAVAIIG